MKLPVTLCAFNPFYRWMFIGGCLKIGCLKPLSVAGALTTYLQDTVRPISWAQCSQTDHPHSPAPRARDTVSAPYLGASRPRHHLLRVRYPQFGQRRQRAPHFVLC